MSPHLGSRQRESRREGGSGATTLGAPAQFGLALAAVSIGRAVSFLWVIFIGFYLVLIDLPQCSRRRPAQGRVWVGV